MDNIESSAIYVNGQQTGERTTDNPKHMMHAMWGIKTLLLA